MDTELKKQLVKSLFRNETDLQKIIHVFCSKPHYEVDSLRYQHANSSYIKCAKK